MSVQRTGPSGVNITGVSADVNLPMSITGPVEISGNITTVVSGALGVGKINYTPEMPITGVFGTGVQRLFFTSTSFTVPEGITSIRVRCFGGGCVDFTVGGSASILGVSATGGLQGTGHNQPGAGGVGSGGDVNYNGGSGGASTSSSNRAGCGGGGSACASGNGGNGGPNSNTGSFGAGSGGGGGAYARGGDGALGSGGSFGGMTGDGGGTQRSPGSDLRSLDTLRSGGGGGGGGICFPYAPVSLAGLTGGIGGGPEGGLGGIGQGYYTSGSGQTNPEATGGSGGGGSGGGTGGRGNGSTTSGNGGGGFAMKVIAVTPGQVIPVSIGLRAAAAVEY